MPFKIYKVFFLCLVFLLWPLSSIAKEIMQQDPRYGFYAFYDTPPGTVAFMPGVYQKEETKIKAHEFYEMESGSYHFPKQPSFCFILNHRNLISEGKTYLAVEIISVMENKQNLPVLLYRNKGWKREKLNPSIKFNGNTAVSFDPNISLDDFFIAHRIEIPPRDVSDIDKKLQYPWHGTVEGSAISSWAKSVIWDKKDLISSEEFFDKFEPPIKEARSDNLRVDAFLISFSPTQRSILDIMILPKPLDFCTTCDGKKAMYLHLYVPGTPIYSHFFITFDK